MIDNIKEDTKMKKINDVETTRIYSYLIEPNSFSNVLKTVMLKNKRDNRCNKKEPKDNLYLDISSLSYNKVNMKDAIEFRNSLIKSK